ncbi:MAG: hypothetical protein QXU98_13220 [Candidatus Parvarchaeota archaeon]
MIDKTVLKRIIDLRNQGMSYQAIVNQLRSEGLADLSPATIRRYLKEIQGEQSSITLPSTNIQEASIETTESVRPANKAPESNNNEVLSKLKKLEEIDKADQKALRRLEIVWTIVKIVIISEVVIMAIATILKLA